MRITDLTDIRAGDNILFAHEGGIAFTLGHTIALFDSSWRKRVKSGWWPWHSGYVVKVLESGEIVTSQALGNGVDIVTYASVADMGDCRIYRWLDNPDENKIGDYAAKQHGWHYDFVGYLWTALGGLSEYLFNYPFRVTDRTLFCWENLSEMDRFMGKQLQPEEEPVLINKMIDALEK